MDMAFLLLSGRRRKLSAVIPSAITAFIRASASAEEGAVFTRMSTYSPSLVSPTPSGAAKDMIMCGLKPSEKQMSIPALRMTF